MSTSVIGKRYARALFALAEEANALDRVQRDLQDFATTWASNKELRGVFDNPAFGAEVRSKILRDLASQTSMHDHVRDLLRMLSDRRRLRHIPEIVESFAILSEARSGKVHAEVTSAAALTPAYLQELAKTLSTAVGREVIIDHKTDPELIGGVVARVGDRVFDGSIRHRLSELREELLR